MSEMVKKKSKTKKTVKEEPWKILKYAHLTEKSITLIERANTIVFIVDRKANKPQITHAFEKAFDAKGKVERVNTEITADGDKKAYIKLKKDFNAGDIAVKLGIV